ncbi:MAG: response regulator [Oscillospiraceae bacterium]|jgi:signal transduction histidine kinase/DNA-binding response OmpR family regulator|nr:response regulator [Oscillospiraceae bacterium]
MITWTRRLLEKYFFSDSRPLAARVFNLVFCSAAVTLLVTTFITLFIMPHPLEIITLVTIDIAVVLMFYICSKYKKYRLGLLLLLGFASFVFFPFMYYAVGGIESGILAYAVMIMVLTFFSLEKKDCFIMILLEIISFAACLCVNNLFPRFFPRPLVTLSLLVMHNAQSVFTVSIFIGIAVKFQMYMYNMEREKAEAASRAKSTFLATVSHEIRTPLNAIIGLSQIQLQADLPKETLSDIEKIYNSGSSLLGIINDILDVSKIESGSFELIPLDYDTPSLIHDTVQLNIVRIGSKPIVFKLRIDETLPSRLYGDELRIKQVLNNLLSNAFKYTKEGEVTFRTTWERHGDDAQITFIVQDTGTGIRQEDIEKLFSEYSQLDVRANRKIEGTGLGLSITKKLVDLMGGTISVESEYGKGSTFTVCFRQKISNDLALGKSTVENLESFRFIDNRRSRGRNLVRAYMPYGKILVVDDVSTNLDVAKGLLLPYGLTVDCALSGREAIEKIRSEQVRYDVVFMDHMMPEMDGMEATQRIRELGTPYAKAVPIIALTANALAGNEEMFIANGFDAFLSKPIDVMRLDVLLNQWVKARQSPDVLRQAALTEKEKNDAAPSRGGDPDALPEDARADGLDVRAGARKYNGAKAYATILQSYIKHTPALLETLRALTEETLPAYAVAVHGLKGSSYGICADAVGAWAETLEAAAKRGDFPTVREENDAFLEKAEALLSDLRALLPRLGTAEESEAEKPVKHAPDSALLEKMREESRNFDAGAMEETLTALEQYRYETDAELVPWLREQLENLEYDAICEKLESICSP